MLLYTFINTNQGNLHMSELKKNVNFISMRIRKETYRKLKQLSLDLEKPLSSIIEIIHDQFVQHKTETKHND